MKIAHLADLHLGKSVNGFSMIEEQKHILQEILDIFKEQQIQTVCIAGDVYDRQIPSIEAVNLLNWFLEELNKESYEVFMIAGNHDNGDRLSFGSSIFDQMHIHIAGNFSGTVPAYEMEDEYGSIVFHLLPFVRPITVNRYIEDENEKAGDYTQAVQKALQRDTVDPGKRNVILSHQFVTGTQVDENGSEELTVGGLDQVAGSVYDAYDYVCLGHIHRPQKVCRETMLYSGTPLKYSFSECSQVKSVPIVTCKEKGRIEIAYVPLHPMHEMREISGTFHEIMQAEKSEDYMHVTLRDEEDIPDAIRSLRQVFPNIMKLDYDNRRTQQAQHSEMAAEEMSHSPMEIFASFYQSRTTASLNEEQKKLMEDLIQEIWEDGQ
ncbi:MAG: exonuclease SbcCD subunit D [Erysipelotrichaceae bacterium]|jgi:exonuclease SbcD|nr:exonuclease SbcCD subunit D [Erysipelotrichaceae bacterium]